MHPRTHIIAFPGVQVLQEGQHIAFMHIHHIAHLDISPRNIVTDFCGNYACIDYECSMRFDSTPEPRICHARIAEPPPEMERGEPSDPYKVDVFGLGVMMLRTMKVREDYCFLHLNRY